VKCYECHAVLKGQHLQHHRNCLVAIEAEAVQAADAAWFEQHPFASECVRPARDAEVVEAYVMGGTRIRPGDRILVQQIAPGIRVRSVVGKVA
jgi:hypothetical protein